MFDIMALTIMAAESSHECVSWPSGVHPPRGERAHPCSSSCLAWWAGFALRGVGLAALRSVMLGMLCVPIGVGYGRGRAAGHADAVGQAEGLGRALRHHGGAAVTAGAVGQRDGCPGVHGLRQGPDALRSARPLASFLCRAHLAP